MTKVPYEKSERELKINTLCESVGSSSGYEKEKARSELLSTIEGDSYQPSNLNPPKIILFNGPPRSGKDTAAKYITDKFANRVRLYRFSGPLKDSTHALFGFQNVSQEHFDKVKERSLDAFFGMSPRQAYIWMSEKVAKPKFGQNFFAKVAVNWVKNQRMSGGKYPLIVIPDCGFHIEAESMIHAFGRENVALVYVEREGTSFMNDSRTYVTEVECAKYSIGNNGTLDELHSKVETILTDFLRS